jgi:hypothetical protein
MAWRNSFDLRFSLFIELLFSYQGFPDFGILNLLGCAKREAPHPC